MGSLIKTYSEEKLNGKIYTPSFVIEKMLNDIGFYGSNVLNKKIIDPACGDGRFLIEIARRIIQNTHEADLENQLKNIYGWDIDQFAVNQCIQNLNELVKPYNLCINWNIEVKNTLYEIENLKQNIFSNKTDKFDIIIGNPPYIRIQHLDTYQRQYIKKNYTFCQSGSTDIYIAFFELCFNLLREKGKGALITPNTYLYTQAGHKIRAYIKENQNVSKISNFKHLQLFKNATTYSAITFFTNEKNNELVYEEYTTLYSKKCKVLPYSYIGSHHFFNSGNNEHSHRNGYKLKDICKIGVGLTTLADKVYIFKDIYNFDKNTAIIDTYYKGKIRIEKDILKPIIKGSTYRGDKYLLNEYILFPYKKTEGSYKIIPEQELLENFPLTYKYLLSVKHILDKRDNGKTNPVSWYAFGRKQSLDTAFGRKIIFSPISKKPNFILSELEEYTLYSGYYIKFNGDYSKLLSELNSKRMEEYIKNNSRDFRDGWKAYNKKILEEFEVFI